MSTGSIVYVYPDGTRSPCRPTDGEIFRYTQHNETWQWDDFLGQWFNISSGTPNAHNTRTHVVPAVYPYQEPDWEQLYPIPDYAENKCECGSESVGSSKHSDWCKKYVTQP